MDAEILQQLRDARSGLIRSQCRLREIAVLRGEQSEIEDLNTAVQILVLRDAIGAIDIVLATYGIN